MRAYCSLCGKKRTLCPNELRRHGMPVEEYVKIYRCRSCFRISGGARGSIVGFGMCNPT